MLGSGKLVARVQEGFPPSGKFVAGVQQTFPVTGKPVTRVQEAFRKGNLLFVVL